METTDQIKWPDKKRFRDRNGKIHKRLIGEGIKNSGLGTIKKKNI